MPIISGGSTSGGVVVKRYFNKPADGITRAATSLGAFSTAWQLTGVVVSASQSVLLTATISYGPNGGNDQLFAILRGVTQIATIQGGANGSATTRTFSWIDSVPGAGTYTYEVQCAALVGNTVTVKQTNPTTDVVGGTSILIAEVYNP